MKLDNVGVVVIGRNEGERLQRCLSSIPGDYPVVYVDSGSVDGSVVAAKSAGAMVVELDGNLGFTAARARNAGWRELLKVHPLIEFVQFVDGDCELSDGWLRQASLAIAADSSLAIVFGRIRERFPSKSIYNSLCDDEWDIPVGDATECGGNAFIRVDSLREVDGYNDGLIAGEEPDLCLRLGLAGWRMRRIDAEMALHDANILLFSSWWIRSKRGGFAYAKHVSIHQGNSLQSWKKSLFSILFWGLVVPILALFLIAWAAISSFAPICQVAVGVVLVYLVQFIRIAWKKRRSGRPWRFAILYAGLTLVGKFAEVSGVLQFMALHLRGLRSELIEYK